MKNRPKRSFIALTAPPLLAATTLSGIVVGSAASVAGEATGDEQPERPLYWPLTVGIEAGTTGFGGFGSWRFLRHFGVRAGADYFSYSDNNFTPKSISYNANLQLLSEPLTFDVYPWKRHDFHISAGVLFNQSSVTGTANHTGIFNREQTLDMKIEPQLANAYLSIGGTFFHFDHAHRWAMGGELGVAYSTSMDVSLSGKGLVPDLIIRREHQDLQDYANQLKFWPVLKITVTYSF